MENSEIFKTMKRQWNILITVIVTGWHGEQWDFKNNEKTMEHSDHWIMSGWYYYYGKCHKENFTSANIFI